jgi:hypothetical protein
MNNGKRKSLNDALREVRQIYHRRIAIELRCTEKSYRQIALDTGCSEGLVYLVNRLSRCRTEPEEMKVENA